MFFSATSALATSTPPVPRSMAALGDSITSAAFANLELQWGSLPWAQATFFETLAAYVASGRNPEMIERPYLSWTTGVDPLNRVSSHARHIQRLLDLEKESTKLKTKNFAVTGAVASDVFAEQSPELTRWSRRDLGQDAPDYVTLLIGANDLCAGRAPEGLYLSQVDRTIKDLLERSPRTHVLVLALPQMERLSETFADQPLTGGHIAGTCGDLWQFTQVCSRVLLERDPEKLREIGYLVQRYNDGLEGIVRQAGAAHGDRVRFSKSLYNVEFRASDLSMDCFHPGARGQARIAEMSWQDTWWAGAR